MGLCGLDLMVDPVGVERPVSVGPAELREVLVVEVGVVWDFAVGPLAPAVAVTSLAVEFGVDPEPVVVGRRVIGEIALTPVVLDETSSNVITPSNGGANLRVSVAQECSDV